MELALLSHRAAPRLCTSLQPLLPQPHHIYPIKRGMGNLFSSLWSFVSELIVSVAFIFSKYWYSYNLAFNL